MSNPFTRRLSRSVTLACSAALMLAGAATADIAMSIDPVPTGGTPAGDSNHGWKFTASEPITVTHLGVYDDDDDGMSIEHPIGIWRASDGQLMVSATLPAGNSSTLIAHYRYVECAPTPLDPNVEYIISFYSATSNTDGMILNAQGTDRFHPAIQKIGNGWWDFPSSGFRMPRNQTSSERYGPNFQFDLGGGGYRLSVGGQCPGTVTVTWSGATPNQQQGIVFASNTGNFAIPSGPCQGTVLGLGSQNIQLVNIISTGSQGSGSVSGPAGTGACGGNLQLVEAPSCNTSNVAQIP